MTPMTVQNPDNHKRLRYAALARPNPITSQRLPILRTAKAQDRLNTFCNKVLGGAT